MPPAEGFLPPVPGTAWLVCTPRQGLFFPPTPSSGHLLAEQGM